MYTSVGKIHGIALFIVNPTGHFKISNGENYKENRKFLKREI